MKTKNILKMLAAVMLLPAMLLTTACSSEDDLANNGQVANPETTVNKGYALQVTVSASRQEAEGAANKRASFNESTRKLEFTAGDKLFVNGYHSSKAKNFAGMLEYDAVSGKFSGTITTQNSYDGTIDDLFTEVQAILLPKDYEEYGFFSISGSGYSTEINFAPKDALALSKATAVEQFSWEYAGSYSSGFALEPKNAVLNFTITGLTASTAVAVAFTYPRYPQDIVISGNVTTDASGTAKFAIGVEQGKDLQNCTLTVGDKEITLVSDSKEVEAGHIYNITRSAAAPATSKALSEVTDSELGWRFGSDGKAYSPTGALPTGVTAMAMIAYVGSETGHDTYKNGLAIALSDEGSMDWSTAKSTCEGKSGAVWMLPSENQWKAMFNANGGSAGSYTGLNTALATAGGDSSKLQLSINYWTSTEVIAGTLAKNVNCNNGNANFGSSLETSGSERVRAVLAF